MVEVRTRDNIRKRYMRTNQTEEQREKYFRAQRELMESQGTNQTEEQMAEVRTIDNIRKRDMSTNQTEERREKYLRAEMSLCNNREQVKQNNRGRNT